MRFLVLVCTLSTILLAGAAAQAQLTAAIGEDVVVELINGDIMSGTVVDVTERLLIIDSPVFKRVEIDFLDIKRTLTTEQWQAAVAEAAAGLAEASAAATAAAAAGVAVEVEEPESPWSGTVDLAIDGSQGNNRATNARAGLNALHKTDEVIDAYSLSWQKSRAAPKDSDKSEETENRFFASARREWYLDDTKWRPFLAGSMTKDTFTDWDTRYTVAVGAAYPVIEEDGRSLSTRLGLGGTYEKSGDKDGWTAEGVLGLTWLEQITENQNFALNWDVYPSLEDQGEYRSLARAQWDATIDPEDPWKVVAGVEHEYDSDPGDGFKSTDLNYFMGLGFGF